MVDEQKELVREKAQLTKQKITLQGRIDVISDTIEKQKEFMEQDIAASREQFFDDIESRITVEYEEQVDSYTERITEIELLIKDVGVGEDDESVQEAVARRDYLNAAAVELQSYYNILIDVSELEFIELAITTKTISMPAFRKEMTRMDYYRLTIAKLQSKTLDCFDDDRNIWMQSVIQGWLLALKLPWVIYNSVKRAKILHLFSRRYYILMETLLVLSQSTNKEIISTLKGVVKEREDNLLKRKQDAEERLNKLFEEIQTKIDLEKKECPDFEADIEAEIFKQKEELMALKQELEPIEEQLRIVTEKLDIILGRIASSFRDIRDRFLNPSNDVKSQNLPMQLIYDYTEAKNNYFQLVSGLWIYTDRTLVNNTVLSIIYQLRNYMEWGSITFNVFDVLMGGFITKLTFAKNCDIRVQSLKDEQDACIDILHDMLVRRNALITQAHDDIHQYNNYQIGIDAPTLPFEIVIIFKEEVAGLNEKMVQIMGRGSQLGILVLVFLRSDLLNSSSFKIYERYVDYIITLTKGGISVEEPRIFGQQFEKKPAPTTKLK